MSAAVDSRRTHLHDRISSVNTARSITAEEIVRGSAMRIHRTSDAIRTYYTSLRSTEHTIINVEAERYTKSLASALQVGLEIIRYSRYGTIYSAVPRPARNVKIAGINDAAVSTAGSLGTRTLAIYRPIHTRSKVRRIITERSARKNTKLTR